MAAKPAAPSATRRVPFVVEAPDAEEVILTGDFTAWSKEGIRLKLGRNGEWSATLQLPVGEYQYRLLIDGRWGNNPAAPGRVPNPFGSENDILSVR